ncbi:hypothetical protein D9M70_606550 [compost metagenome]
MQQVGREGDHLAGLVVQLPRADPIGGLHAFDGGVAVHVATGPGIVESHGTAFRGTRIARIDAVDGGPAGVGMVVQALEPALPRDMEPGVHVQVDVGHVFVRQLVDALDEGLQ